MSKPTPNTETTEMVTCLPLTAKERDLLLFGMATLIDTTTEHAEPAEAMFAKIEEAPTLNAAEQRASSDVKVKGLEAAERIKNAIADLQGEHEVMAGPFDAAKWSLDIPVTDLQDVLRALDAAPKSDGGR